MVHTRGLIFKMNSNHEVNTSQEKEKKKCKSHPSLIKRKSQWQSIGKKVLKPKVYAKRPRKQNICMG